MASNYEEKYCILWDLHTCKSKEISSIVQQIRQRFVKNCKSEFWCFTMKAVKKQRDLESKNDIKFIQRDKFCVLHNILTNKLYSFIQRGASEEFKPKVILMTEYLDLVTIKEQIKNLGSDLYLIHGDNVSKDLIGLTPNTFAFKELAKNSFKSIGLSNSPFPNEEENFSSNSSEARNTWSPFNVCMKNKKSSLDELPYQSTRGRQIQESHLINDNSIKNSDAEQNLRSYAGTTVKNKLPIDYRSSQNFHYKNKKVVGVCGLINLGNTCFMNSALQCLSNIPIFTNFIIDDYRKISFHSTSLGIRRKKLLDYYCEVIKHLWSKQYSPFSLKEFRQEVSKISSQFQSYEQNDCCEFMTFILDRFHEELNQCNVYKDINIDWQSLNTNGNFSDYITKYKLVNNTFISENFHGFQKFSLNCICGQTFSTNFSPFSCINLPHPNTKEETTIRHSKNDKNWKKLNISFIPLFENSFDINIIKLSIIMPKDGIVVNHIREKTAQTYNMLCGKNLNYHNLVVAEIICSRVEKVYKNDEYFSKNTEDITVYEISPLFKKQFFVTLLSQEFSPTLSFGLPFVINTDDSSYDSINKAFIKVFMKFLNLNGDQTDIFELKMDFSLIIYGILLPDNDILQYKLSESYDLPQNSIIFAEIPVEFQEKYQQDRINEISTDSKVPELPNYISNKTISLYDCLDQYLAIEELSDKMLCNYCYSLQTPIKRIEIVKAPKILLLQLKRSRNLFGQNYHSYYYSSTNSNFVDFPIELSLDNYVSAQQQNNQSLLYDLIAISNHSGSNFGGHYTTYAKNCLNSKWYCFNDSCVNEISDKRLVTQNAYLLVYMKRKQQTN